MDGEARAGLYLDNRRVSAVDGRTAVQEGVGKSYTAIILLRAKQWQGVCYVSGGIQIASIAAFKVMPQRIQNTLVIETISICPYSSNDRIFWR